MNSLQLPEVKDPLVKAIRDRILAFDKEGAEYLLQKSIYSRLGMTKWTNALSASGLKVKINVLVGLIKNVTFTSSVSTACIILNTRHIYISPAFFLCHVQRWEDILFLLLHERMHGILYMIHGMVRKSKLQFKYNNILEDIYINAKLRKQIKSEHDFTRKYYTDAHIENQIKPTMGMVYGLRGDFPWWRGVINQNIEPLKSVLIKMDVDEWWQRLMRSISESRYVDYISLIEPLEKLPYEKEPKGMPLLGNNEESDELDDDFGDWNEDVPVNQPGTILNKSVEDLTHKHLDTVSKERRKPDQVIKIKDSADDLSQVEQELIELAIANGEVKDVLSETRVFTSNAAAIAGIVLPDKHDSSYQRQTITPRYLSNKDLFNIASGQTPVLYTEHLTAGAPKIKLYQDVSFSMQQYYPIIPKIAKMLADHIEDTICQFANGLFEVDPYDGKLFIVHGTNYNIVANDILNNGHREVMILTDNTAGLNQGKIEALGNFLTRLILVTMNTDETRRVGQNTIDGGFRHFVVNSNKYPQMDAREFVFTEID